MRLTCVACGSPIAGEAIDLSKGLAVCRSCGDVVPLPAAAELREGAARSVGELKVVPPRPVDLRLEELESPGGFRWVIRFPRWPALPILGFAAVWDGFLVFWYVAAFHLGGGPAGLALWFPLLHVAAGIAITYGGLVKLFNRVEVTMDAEQFTVSHRPIPRPGGLRRSTLGILEVRPSPERRQGSTSEGGGADERGLELLFSDGRCQTLQLGLSSARQADYLAFRLNAALHSLLERVGYR